MNRSATRLAIGVSTCAVFFLSSARVARAAGVVGTGTAASCTEAALDAALAGGGLVTFECGGPATIDITAGAGKTITADTRPPCMPLAQPGAR